MTAVDRSVILCNHSNTERPFLANVLKDKLASEMSQEDAGEWEVVVSEADKDPLEVV
jgi:putative NIF3 family GTP cyclohydrolase 1 type 2